MHNKKAVRLTAMCAVMTFAMMAFAADRPKLTIESPENNATVQSRPGIGEVVVIKFRADNFRIMGLNESMQNDRVATTNDNQPMSQGSTQGDNKPMSESLPQTDQGAERNEQGLPQRDQSAASMNAAADQGYIHVFVDGGKWYWVHSSNDPIVLAGLPKGDHSVKLELVDSKHESIGVSESVDFSVPR